MFIDFFIVSIMFLHWPNCKFDHTTTMYRNVSTTEISPAIILHSRQIIMSMVWITLLGTMRRSSVRHKDYSWAKILMLENCSTFLTISSHLQIVRQVINSTLHSLIWWTILRKFHCNHIWDAHGPGGPKAGPGLGFGKSKSVVGRDAENLILSQ